MAPARSPRTSTAGRPFSRSTTTAVSSFVIAFSKPDLPTAPLKNADESMSRVVGAIRRDSCEDLLPFSLGKGKKYCAGSPIRQLHTALDRAYTASPKLLGGDGRYAFYGLKVKPYYFTLVFLASKNGS